MLALPKRWHALVTWLLFGWPPIFWLAHPRLSGAVYFFAKSLAKRGRKIGSPKFWHAQDLVGLSRAQTKRTLTA
jgi:hypothetical protein